ncbi:MAG: DUF4097 family beta strand repeat-containing protein [Bacilli bacterium]
MKTTAIVKIVLFSILTVFLTVFLMKNLNPIKFPAFRINSNLFYNQNQEIITGDYKKGSGNYNANDVTSMDINWVAGEVDIQEYDGTDIIFEEISNGISEKYKMHHTLSNGKLTINYSKSNSFNGFGFGVDIQKKNLTIKVPKNKRFEKLELNIVGTETNISNIKSQDMHFITVNGDINGNNLTAKNLSGESVSGQLNLTGDFNSIDYVSVSGKINITDTVCPEVIECESVSGSLNITIPENDGFTLKYDKVSGYIDCDFETKMIENRKLEHKNGSADFKFNTVSGEISIKKIK